MWKCRLHVALLCAMLVVLGLITRCAAPVVSCMHGHLDMLMGNPRCRGRRGLLVLVLVHGVSRASRSRQDTRAPWLHSHCLLALKSREARWGFGDLSEMHSK